MTGNMQLDPGPLPADDDPDTISVTSEGDQDYDADTEFVVEDVHCERVDPRDGVLKYLVEWANFPLDECTWEPGESLPQELRDQWESKKAKQDPSVAAAFEKKYNEAFNEKLEERRLKHRRRNAKRRRKGMRETNFWFRGHYYPDSDDGLDVEVIDEANNEAHNEPDTPSDEGAEEAKEDNSIDHGAKDSFLPLESSSQTKPQKSVTQPNRIFKTDPNIASEPQAKTGSRIDETLSLHQSHKTTSTSDFTSLLKARSLSSLPERPREGPSTTGYQGSARRSSITQDKSKPRKSSVSATRPGNALDGATTTASNFAHKNITAKKSGQAPISAVNIFTGGRKRQPRQNLGSTMIDANKAPKLFTKARLRRKAELRSRDNDDRAPDPSQVLLFNISQPPPPRPISRPSYDDGDGLIASNADEPRVQADAMTPASVRRDSTTANEPKSVLTKRRSSGLDGDRARKKAKSVRFTGEEDQPFVSEPMGISEPLGPPLRMRSPPPPPRSPSPPVAPKAMLCPADYNSRTVQSVSKKVILAPRDHCLDVTFNGIPKDASQEEDQQWLSKFLGSESLRVDHTILAESLVAQLTSMRRSDPLGRGYDILCSGTITSISGNQLDVLAEHLRVGRFGLLIAHENYNFVIYPTKCDDFQMQLLGVEPSKADEVALKYFAFGMSHNIPRLIRPKPATIEESTDVPTGQEQRSIFRRLLDLQYQRLVAGPCEDKEHHFYLIFPDAAVDWYRSLCCWLLACKPECKIYTSFDPGSWSAFLEKASNQCGAVIIHEAAVSCVRKIPRVAESLRSHNIQYWCFSESVDMQPIPYCVSGINRPIPTQLSRVFPWGKAILLTPSFILSEPQKTYDLFRWYLPNQAKQSIKLVTAYNIVGFLRDLTDEKYALQAKFRQTRWKTMSSLDVAIERKAAGLTDEDLDARAKTWLLAENWLSVSMERNGILSDNNHVIFADRSIDPNDEQSLVNWFGWWSLAKAEEYRKFFVLGTGTLLKDTNRSQFSLLSRARRTILLPKYGRYVVNDPNEALRIAMGNAGELAGEKATVPPAMPSWFRWPFPWLGDNETSFNTYIAFFYTIKEDWDPDKFPQGIKPKRHPWLAFYRPAEPHNRFGGYRHGKTELIIWDVRAGDVLEDDFALGLQDLTWMQRELVRFVQAHGADKNPGSQLESVWLGGFKGHQAECSSTLAADITAEWMESTLANLKYKLPSTEGYMKQNGWRKVSLLKPLGPNRRLKNRQSIGEDDAAEEAANEEDTRIIFHPPRGSGTIGPRGSSKCKNDLYEAARLARLRDSNAREMDYTFRPTMEWYNEMIAEGRQYEHIFVDGWEKVFAQLGVFQNQRPKASRASTASGQNGHTRTSSVTSSHSSSMDVNPV
ncbi:hypothetical protein SLS53_001834 [Cytospora paraplurivora]|uniref:Chromo domain-containing protein n=1 Tax=Cytospora paraplurivora TaxID=2898453 RepID=A0AAN9UE66_9PEZI